MTVIPLERIQYTLIIKLDLTSFLLTILTHPEIDRKYRINRYLKQKVPSGYKDPNKLSDKTECHAQMHGWGPSPVSLKLYKKAYKLFQKLTIWAYEKSFSKTNAEKFYTIHKLFDGSIRTLHVLHGIEYSSFIDNVYKDDTKTGSLF